MSVDKSENTDYSRSPEDDGEMFLFSIKESDLNPDGVADASKWNQYQLPGRTSLQPALVNEEGQLALYFVSDNQYKNILVIRSIDPQDSALWVGSGSLLPWNNPNNTATDIQINSGNASPQTANIAATRFHALTRSGELVNRTYLAFCMNTNGGSGDDQVFVVEQPADATGQWIASQAFNAEPGYIYLSGNASQLSLVTTNLTGNNNPFGVHLYNTIDSSPASATLQGGANATVVGASTIGGQLTLQTQSTQFFGSTIALQPVATPWTSATQQSLAGYSIDGNIDVNGDGFKDMLVSDPSDPSRNVDNQYALFGGDYLNIASQVGTPGDDVMIGTPLADVIYSIQGADQVTSNGGADVIVTGAGDDAISIQDNVFIRIDAGSGFDQLLLQGLANQSYDFRLNVANPEYFAGTKLRDIELISSLDYGANTLSFDAAAINAINTDRVLFVTPDASDSIALSTEFARNTNFDTSYGGSLWSAYAAAPASAAPADSNPALLYVRTPTGQTADWLSAHVTTTATAPTTTLRTAPASPADALASLPTASPIAGSQPFGDGLTLLAYRSTPTSGVARFAIERSDTRKRQVIAYTSSSANSSAEPGRHYSPVAGLLVLDPGQTRQVVTVPINADAMAALKGGRLSLAVEEFPDQGQSAVHFQIQPDADGRDPSGLPPTLSGLSLTPSEDHTSITLSFRADSNGTQTTGKGRKRTTQNILRLALSQRPSADSQQPGQTKTVVLTDAAAASGKAQNTGNPFATSLAADGDQRLNNQISTSVTIQLEDGDGYGEVTMAADGRYVDGNRDRTPDATQGRVAALALLGDGTQSADFGAIAVAKKRTLSNVQLLAIDAGGDPLGAGLTSPLSAGVQFAVSNLQAGATTKAALSLPIDCSLRRAKAFLSFNVQSGQYEEFMTVKGCPRYWFSDTNRDGIVDSVSLKLRDGNQRWDGDGKRDGSVLASGYVVSGRRDFVGTNNNDLLIGNALANTIKGRGGNDDLQGGLSHDVFLGGDGDDSLDGGLGADLLSGKRGRDVYLYRTVAESTPQNADTVTMDRFDRFDLRAIDANSVASGKQNFQFIGRQAFSGVAGELRATRSLLAADTDGDRHADLLIQLQGNVLISGTNLIL